MERVFTGRELVNTSSRLERNAAIDNLVAMVILVNILAHVWQVICAVNEYLSFGRDNSIILMAGVGGHLPLFL